MIILGADPGFASFGWIVIDWPGRVVSAGVIETVPTPRRLRHLQSDDNVRRCVELARSLYDAFDGDGLDIARVCAESFSPPRHATAAAKVAMAWGVLVALAELHRAPILQLSPQAIRGAILGGAGRGATKTEVARAVCERFPELDPDGRIMARIRMGAREHVYDAAAAAIACMEAGR